MPILAIRSLTRSLHSTGKWVFRKGTHDKQQKTDGHCNLESESVHRADAVKMELCISISSGV